MCRMLNKAGGEIMEYFDVFGRLTYKFNVLYMLMLNYCRTLYSDNKSSNGTKILILCENRRDLIKNYEKIYTIIRKFKPKDIYTLKKFICFYDKQLQQLLSKFDDKGISYSEIIRNIKQLYTEDKSIYINPRRNISINIPRDKNLVFTEFSNAGRIYDKHLVKQIFIAQKINSETSNILCTLLTPFVKDIIKEKDILSFNGSTSREFTNLSIFINSEQVIDIDIADELISNLKEDYIDE